MLYVYYLSIVVLKARNIRNKPVMNKDPHAVQMEEMQCQIEVGVMVSQ